MRKTILLLFFLIGFQFVLNAQFVLRLEYQTSSPEVEKIIKKTKLKKKYKSNLKIQSDLEKLKNNFIENNYLSFSVDNLDSSENIYTAYLHIGEPIRINKIEVKGVDENIISKSGIRKRLANNEFSMNDVFSYSLKIFTYLENHGYPFASVKLEEITSDSTVIISVEQNNFIAWDTVILKGDVKLSKSFLYGYFNVKKKRAYNESVVRKIPDLVRALSFAEVLNPASVSFSQKDAALYLYLKKRKVNQFDGYLGIIPQEENSEKVSVTGSLNLSLKNVLTLGEEIDLKWESPHSKSQNLDVFMLFPYLFKTRFGIDAAFSLLKKDTNYLNLTFLAGIRYYFNGSNYIKAFYRHNNSRLIATEHLKYATQLPENIDYNLNLYGFEVNQQKLDYPFNPRKGYVLKLNVSIGKREIIENTQLPAVLFENINKETIQLQANLYFSYFIPIKKRWTFLTVLQGGYLHGNSLFENELYRIGGMKTIRGFNEQSINASSYGVLNLELRFLFRKESFLYAFFDAGWYEKKYLGDYLRDFPFGFGLGVAFDTKAGIFSLSYALGKQLSNPIDIKTGKVTFGYVALF